MRPNCGIAVVSSLIVATIGITSASAQTAFRIGASITAISAVVRGSNVAYDYKDSIYLVVSAHGGMNGVLIGADGAIGAPFALAPEGTFNQFPGVAYSPDLNGGAGGFLVTWHQSLAAGGAVVHARFVSTSGVPGPELGAPGCTACQVSVDGSWWEAAADIAYSTTSKEFLVVWQGAGIRGQRIALDGTLVGTNFGITPASYHRDPAVVYNPTNNEFMVVFGGADATSAFAGFQRVAAGSGALVGPETILNRAGAVYIAEVAYNSTTNQYLAAWYQGGTYGSLIDAGGNVVPNWNGERVSLLSTTVTAYDALGIDYNASSKTFMMVSHSTSSFQDGAVELAGATAFPDVGILATASAPATSGNFYPKIASRAGKAEWLMSTATGFSATTIQRLGSTASGGGGGTPPPPPPPSCTPSLSSTTLSVPSSGGSFHVDVVVPAGCSWSAATAASWIQITWNASASGPASVGLNIIRNLGVPSRTGTITVAGQSVTIFQPGFNAASTDDMSGDGFSDLVWQYQPSGALSMWSLRGNKVLSTQVLPSVADPTWKVAGTGDLNGDGYADLVWQKTDGSLAAWFMRPGQLPTGRALSYPSVDPNWKVRGVGDLNGDGYADIVMQHTSEGWLTVWFMYGFNVVSTALLSVPRIADPNWVIVAAADINGDHKADIMWQNQSTGVLVGWIMDGAQVTILQKMSSWVTDLNWKVRGLGDVDGDGIADLIWQNISTGEIGTWILNGFVVQYGMTIFNNGVPAVVDPAWQIVGPG